MDNLSVEQQFSIVSFNTQADNMSREQAIEILKTTYKAYVVQKQTYLELLKHSWFPVQEDLGESNKR